MIASDYGRGEEDLHYVENALGHISDLTLLGAPQARLARLVYKARFKLNTRSYSTLEAYAQQIWGEYECPRLLLAQSSVRDALALCHTIEHLTTYRKVADITRREIDRFR